MGELNIDECNVSGSYSLVQLIAELTRVTVITETLFDLILIDKTMDALNSGVVAKHDAAGHSLVYCILGDLYVDSVCAADVNLKKFY